MDEAATDVASEGRAGRAPVGIEEVYRRDHDRLVRLAFLLTSSTDTAHDLVHDAFGSASLRWAEVREPAAYLRRAVVNGAAQHHRQRHRHRAAMERHGPSTTSVAADDEYLADLIAALPFRQQAVVVLRFWGGLTEAEIAAAVGCRPGTVGPTLTRALRRLRNALGAAPHASEETER